jgi:uncharacterized protein YdeI (YjbR/CyaY-like superfamily)
MKNASPAVDAYIAKSPAYSQPILKKIRQLFHGACPHIEETIKWGMPHFEYKGIVASMAAFKQHARFGFWKGGIFKGGDASGLDAQKLTSVEDLPPDKVLIAYIKEAIELNEKEVKAPRTPKKPPKTLKVPAYFQAALKKNKKAQAAFESFRPSHQREYIEWITEAKQEETRQNRLATALEWLAEGKHRNWKYERL